MRTLAVAGIGSAVIGFWMIYSIASQNSQFEKAVAAIERVDEYWDADESSFEPRVLDAERLVSDVGSTWRYKVSHSRVNLCLATEKTLRAYRDSQITFTNNAIETAERNYGRATALRVKVAFMRGDSGSFVKEDKQEQADERMYSSHGIPDNGYRQQLADSIKVAREHMADLEKQRREASDCLADLRK
jgi:hypothetical protein